MAYLYPIDLKAEYGIAAPVLASGVVVEGRNALEFDSFNPGIVFDHLGIAFYSRNIAVVRVVMAHGNDVRRLIYLPVAELIVRLIRVGDNSHATV